MKFFTSALVALPLIGSVLASPIAGAPASVAAKQDKRLLGLDLGNLGLGGLGGLGNSKDLDLVGLIDKLTAELVRLLTLTL
jgi:hypothetical protein